MFLYMNRMKVFVIKFSCTTELEHKIKVSGCGACARARYDLLSLWSFRVRSGALTSEQSSCGISGRAELRTVAGLENRKNTRLISYRRIITVRNKVYSVRYLRFTSHSEHDSQFLLKVCS